MKKAISCFLSFCLLFAFSVPVFAQENTASNSIASSDAGTYEEYYTGFSASARQKIAEMIGSGNVAKVKSSTYYLPGNSLQRGNISASSLSLTITKSYICPNKGNKITSVLVAISWEWAANKPVYRGKDAISLNWDSTYFIKSSDDSGVAFYAQDVYRSNSSDEWTVYKEYNTLAMASQGGLGHYTDLKALKKYVGGAMIILLEPRRSIVKGNGFSSELNVEYVHSYLPITGLCFSTNDFGISVSWDRGCDYLSASNSLYFSFE